MHAWHVRCRLGAPPASRCRSPCATLHLVPPPPGPAWSGFVVSSRFNPVPAVTQFEAQVRRGCNGGGSDYGPVQHAAAGAAHGACRRRSSSDTFVCPPPPPRTNLQLVILELLDHKPLLTGGYKAVLHIHSGVWASGVHGRGFCCLLHLLRSVRRARRWVSVFPCLAGPHTRPPAH